MAKEVKVSIIVDDNGTMRLTEKSAKKLGASMDNAAAGSRRAQKAIKGTAQTASAGSKNFSKQAGIIQGGLVPAYATLAAQVFAVSAAFLFLKDAGSLEQLKAGQQAYFSATGQSTKQLTQNIIEATNAQISFTDAAQAASIGLASGLNAEQVTKLGKAAADVSQILGRDLTDSFNRLVRGVTKAEPELLDELGIVLRLKTATEEYKRSLNIQGELTQFQRSQAVTAEVLSQVENKYSRVLDVVGNSPNQFAQLAKSFDDIVLKIKEFAVVIAGPIVELLKEFPSLIALAFAPFAGTLIQTLLPNLSKFGDVLNGLSKSAENLGATAAQKLGDLEQKSLMSMDSKERLKQIRHTASEQIKTIEKTTVINKRSLLNRLRDQKNVETKQLQSIKRQAVKQLGVYKTMNAQIRADLIKTIDQMILINKAGTDKMAADFGILGAKAKITFFGIAVAGTGMFATLATGAAALGGFIATALSVLSWVALIAVLGGLVYSFFKTKEATEEAISVTDRLSEKVKSASAEITQFAKVQNILYEETQQTSRVLMNFANVLNNIPESELFGAIQDEGKLTKKTILDIANAQRTLTANLEEQEEKALPLFERINELLEIQKKATLTKGFSFTASLSQELEKAQEEFTRVTSLSQNLFQVLAEGEGPLKAFGTRILQEKKELEDLSFTALAGTPAVINFLEAIKDFDGTQASIDNLLSARKAFRGLGAAIQDAERQRSANEKSTADYFNSFYPDTESQRVLGALKSELKSLEDLKKQQTFLDAAQQKRLETLKETIPTIQAITREETKLASTLNSLNVKYTRGLLGATNLQKEQLGLEKDISNKKSQIVSDQNKIKNLIRAVLNDSGKLLEYQAADEAGKKQILDSELAIDTTRKNQLGTLEQSIALKTVELDIIQRQSVAMKELADNAFQAFESNLQSGIAALIKGTEKSFKDFALNITKGVLTNVADTLAKQMTTSIINLIKPRGKTVDEKIKEVFENVTLPQRMFDSIVAAGNHIAEVFGVKTTTASSSATDITAPPAAGTTPNLTSAVSPSADKKGFWEKILGRKKTTTVSTEELKGKAAGTVTVGASGSGRSGGIFSQFINDFGAVFDKNSEGGFLEKMGNLFGSFGEGLMGLFKGLPDLLGGLFGGGGGGLGGLFAGIFGAAAGGIMPGGVTGYANGGIVKRPTVGLVGEGKMNEAVVPLPDGKAIPVNMGSGMGQNNNVTVNVSMDGQGNSQSQSNSDGQMGANMGKLIAGAVQDELQRQKRPGGILSPYGAA